MYARVCELVSWYICMCDSKVTHVYVCSYVRSYVQMPYGLREWHTSRKCGYLVSSGTWCLCVRTNAFQRIRIS